MSALPRKEAMTSMGRVVLEGTHLIVVHVRGDARITAPMVQEVIRTRHRLAPGIPVAMYFIIEGELDWELPALQTDHFALEGEMLKAVAVMVNAPVFTTVVNVYFSMFPGHMPHKVFSQVEEGYAWLAGLGAAAD